MAKEFDVSPIRASALPENSFLSKYARREVYTDCFTTETDRPVSLAVFVEAFYTSWLFKFERLALTLLVFKPSSDADAEALASGTSDAFAAWTVESRSADQLLVRDFLSYSRSWLMVGPGRTAGSTRLYFGTAMTPKLGYGFKAFVGMHRIYSRALLHVARKHLERG